MFGYCNLQKPVIEVINGGLTAGKSDAAKKAVAAVNEKSAVSGRRSRGGASKKNARAFTSILSARSKVNFFFGGSIFVTFCSALLYCPLSLLFSQAACGLTSKPKDPKVDIDAADADNELAVVEYLDEIYQFYKLTEVLTCNSTLILSLTVSLSLSHIGLLCFLLMDAG